MTDTNRFQIVNEVSSGSKYAVILDTVTGRVTRTEIKEDSM